MKAIATVVLASLCVLTFAGCTGRNQASSSSSMPSSSVSSTPIPSSSVPPSSSMPTLSSSSMHSSGVISDLEDAASDAMDDVSRALTPTMSADFSEIGALDGSPVRWGPGTLVDETTNRTTASESLQTIYEKWNAHFIGPADSGKFYLTFDCGYENGETGKILDVLKEKDVKAVFFITGHYAKSAPELVQRMIDEGHIIGNHTSNHYSPDKHSIPELAEDMQSLQNYMKDNFNYEMFLYRPPEGVFTEQSLALAQQMGYTTVLWSFAYADWDPKNQMGPEAALARTTRFIHEGAIYLMHTVGVDNTLILGDLIDAVRAKGLVVAQYDIYPTV